MSRVAINVEQQDTLQCLDIISLEPKAICRDMRCVGAQGKALLFEAACQALLGSTASSHVQMLSIVPQYTIVVPIFSTIIPILLY